MLFFLFVPPFLTQRWYQLSWLIIAEQRPALIFVVVIVAVAVVVLPVSISIKIGNWFLLLSILDYHWSFLLHFQLFIINKFNSGNIVFIFSLFVGAVISIASKTSIQPQICVNRCCIGTNTLFSTSTSLSTIQFSSVSHQTITFPLSITIYRYFVVVAIVINTATWSSIWLFLYHYQSNITPILISLKLDYHWSFISVFTSSCIIKFNSNTNCLLCVGVAIRQSILHWQLISFSMVRSQFLLLLVYQYVENWVITGSLSPSPPPHVSTSLTTT